MASWFGLKKNQVGKVPKIEENYSDIYADVYCVLKIGRRMRVNYILALKLSLTLKKKKIT